MVTNLSKIGWFCVLIASIFVLIAPLGVRATENSESSLPPRIEIIVENDLVTLTAQSAPLRQVIKELAARAHLALKIKTSLSNNIDLSFADMPIETAVRRLLHQNSFVMTYVRDPTGKWCNLVGLTILGSHIGSVQFSAIETVAARPDPQSENPDGIEILIGDPIIRELMDDMAPIDVAERNRVLTSFSDDMGVEELVTLALMNDNKTIRTIAVLQLGRLGRDGPKNALIEALSDSDRQVRVHAVQALGSAWRDDALEPLSTTLVDDPDPIVRRAAALSIARIPGKASQVALKLAQIDNDPLVSEVIDYLLENWGKTDIYNGK